MASDIFSGVVGFLLGILSSYIASRIYEYRTDRKHVTQLKKTYKDLAGTYVSYRVTDGTEEPTSSTVKITQRANGLFCAKGLYPHGAVEWSSDIIMKLEPINTGTGSFHYREQPTEYGIQQIRFIPETRSLHVVSSHTSRGKPIGFVRHWKYKEA